MIPKNGGPDLCAQTVMSPLMTVKPMAHFINQLHPHRDDREFPK
jgi:hypothetical protein